MESREICEKGPVGPSEQGETQPSKGSVGFGDECLTAFLWLLLLFFHWDPSNSQLLKIELGMVGNPEEVVTLIFIGFALSLSFH